MESQENQARPIKGVPVTRGEMETAYRAYLRGSSSLQDANLQKLALFYALECGIKSALAKKESWPYDRFLDDTFTKDIGHRLNKGLKDLRINLFIDDVKRGANRSGSPYSVNYLHEAWRYHASLDPESEAAAIQQIQKALDELENRS